MDCKSIVTSALSIGHYFLHSGAPIMRPVESLTQGHAPVQGTATRKQPPVRENVMKKLLILGASGNIAQWVIRMLAERTDAELPNTHRLRDHAKE